MSDPWLRKEIGAFNVELSATARMDNSIKLAIFSHISNLHIFFKYLKNNIQSKNFRFVALYMDGAIVLQ